MSADQHEILAAMKQYHEATTAFLKSCTDVSENYIGGIEELRLRDAWGNAERLLIELQEPCSACDPSFTCWNRSEPCRKG